MSVNPKHLDGLYPKPNGILQGVVKQFYTSGPAAGKIKSTQYWVQGVKEGYYEFYDESGDVTNCIIYENDQQRGSCL